MTKKELRTALVFADEDIEAVVTYQGVDRENKDIVAYFVNTIEAQAFCDMARKELVTTGAWEVSDIED